MRIIPLLFTLFFSLLCFVQPLWAEDSGQLYRLVFAKFDKNSIGKYGFLGDSIENMLMSRLASRDRIQVIDTVLSKQDLAQLKERKLAGLFPADDDSSNFLVTGGVFETVSGLTVNITLYPLSGDRDEQNYTVNSLTEKEIISDIERLASKIAAESFGYKIVEKAKSEKGDPSGLSGFTTAHPEEAYKRGLYTGTVAGSGRAGFTVASVGVKRKLTFDKEITALAAGDIDGNGVQEFIVLQHSTLEAYRVSGRRIVKLGSIELSRDVKIHALNLVDVDEDGTQEIVLSATSGIDVASLILGWRETRGFEVIADYIRWYLRPVDIPGEGVRLCGQRRGTERLELVRPGIFVMDVAKDFVLKPQQQLALPPGLNLFDFSYADLDGDNFYEVVAVDGDEHLRVYSPSNQLMWVSSAKFGGSKMYLGPNTGGAINEQDRKNFTADEDGDRELVFVPARILVTDLDQNGADEIVINENKMTAFGFFEKLRPYKSGSVVGMAWVGDELVEAWRTGSYRGYLVDYAVRPPVTPPTAGSAGKSDKNEGATLFIANIPASGSLAAILPGGSRSELAVYDLVFSQKVAE
ncbi:FG-GAP repeat domain-containing protein [Desulforhopalus singaporensis]|uniref:Repeat domain-containing protein n=1 Tax=Desulforhopalus singaporensis TaxID=91360 RepID=A0A1H0M7U2_9BACT|nr:VCBS repeat-containing protein [Desulforhopalus singaporensis]SDO76427.1 hypothetical protein SAMN05660330_01014 [Desulforhopalus singaporensis]